MSFNGIDGYFINKGYGYHPAHEKRNGGFHIFLTTKRIIKQNFTKKNIVEALEKAMERRSAEELVNELERALGSTLGPWGGVVIQGMALACEQILGFSRKEVVKFFLNRWKRKHSGKLVEVYDNKHFQKITGFKINDAHASEQAAHVVEGILSGKPGVIKPNAVNPSQKRIKDPGNLIVIPEETPTNLVEYVGTTFPNQHGCKKDVSVENNSEKNKSTTIITI